MELNADINEIIVPTGTVKDGDTVKAMFESCIKYNVPALPFRDHEGLIRGFVSLKQVMGQDCLPNYLVELAGILHNDMNCTSQAMEKIHTLFCKPVNDYVEKPIQFVTSDTILIRVVALMEEHNSDFLFVADGQDKPRCDYKGIITRLSVAKKMLQIEREKALNCSG
ncbi:MAG: CBS domain-containing protein [gamma proteobacterium symbiont of Bathyaustriella thionipta]|nr:CBS domain-containing protein [gamma proteobacterium symbiont of Bathyaustriella thionipta]MCU7949433.1 CBS domain-containing protein [gamma proteobacterium symbiont of Bathyaustriella thionipta]MCU7954035.1 CBS domain-containing protein [gamma proteobacterium symbiont of Bathyaustriella thionipta]MCU7956020.1 CBS domain-containing protein [gamma proteobacterium symbiont of Bathyaustriella thionipta]MCU7967950.1 CBS domain-containing protein [gamma proteobacterium symbiont of Bathyaustriella